MSYIKLPYENLKSFSLAVFKKMGFPEKSAEIITDVLLTSDLYGIESHGMQRMILYYKSIKNGNTNPSAQPEIVFETPISAVIDNHLGAGQTGGFFAMNTAIKKAKENGIGLVSVRNSNHYGIAGYYAKMACKDGLIGFSSTNSPSIMVPTYGKKAMLGSNPIAIAVPAEPYDFLFDASTTVVTMGKIEVYDKNNSPLPFGWALDENGIDTDNAPLVLKNIRAKNCGGILPLGGSTEKYGGHKGYGYGMISEIFTSILSMGLTSNHFGGGKPGTCHFFGAINPNLFGNPVEIKEHFSAFLQELRNSPKADGQTRIYTHGEKEVEAEKRIMKDGIPVNINTFNEMKTICGGYNIDITEFFDDLKV